MDPNVKSVDPITFEILSHRLYQITKEMGTTLERVGGTVNTTQQRDYMASLYRANGDVLSAGDAMAQHAACAGFAVKRIIDRFGSEGGIDPDDIFLLNDPYLAAIHQSDVYVISPIHYGGHLVAWSATFVHVMDIGAMSPGGNSPGATEICHEGVRIPGIKLVQRGKLCRDVFDAITNMTRQPVMVGLDLKCEIAANNVAKSRMQAMHEQYGPELVDAVSLEMIRYSERILRRRLAEISDGIWTDEAVIQADETWKLRLTLQKRGEGLLFDFTGTDKQAKRGINLPYHATFGICYKEVVGALAYDIPKNHGAFGPMELIAPEGTIVNVKPPGPVSLNTTSGMAKVTYLASSTLAQMLATSEKWKAEVTATNTGGRTARHAGVNQHGRYYVSGLGSENALSGGGARSTGDGIDSGGIQMSCPNVEWTELNFPLLFLFRRHLMDGAGAGRFRGGVGTERAFKLHDAPEGKIKGVAMGVPGLRNSGQGIFGGYPGAPSLLMLLENTRIADLFRLNKSPENLADFEGNARQLPYCEFELKESDVLYMSAQSGGGYGDPLEREPESVLSDVIHRLISAKVARDVYGVVVEEGRRLDLIGIKNLRDIIKDKRLREVNGAVA